MVLTHVNVINQWMCWMCLWHREIINIKFWSHRQHKINSLLVLFFSWDLLTVRKIQNIRDLSFKSGDICNSDC